MSWLQRSLGSKDALVEYMKKTWMRTSSPVDAKSIWSKNASLKYSTEMELKSDFEHWFQRGEEIVTNGKMRSIKFKNINIH